MTDPIPHPRETYDWLGPEAPERAFLDGLARGRLHHAWLLAGPAGVGKATFAYRAARRLLGARPDSARGLLGAAPEDPVSRRIEGRAHPDLLVLQRDPEDGKTRRNIPVEEARALPEFFSKSPAASPYRVAIIDAADDLNASSANALLKTMEEPPTRGVLFLVCQSPGALLATIRSRGRRLNLPAPAADLSAPWLARRLGVDADSAARLLAMSRSAPGGAWRLGVAGALETEAAATALLAALPRGDAQAEQALAEGFRGPNGAARFQMVMERLADLARERILARVGAGEGARALDPWARVWQELTELPGRVEAVNLDRTEAFFVTLARLRAIA